MRERKSYKLGWDQIDVRKRQDLDEYHWHRGFFQKDWKPDLYQRNFNELRMRDISLFELGSVEGKSVLDIGCGAGMYVLTFLKLGAAYVAGQDISEEAVEAGKAFCKKNGFSPDLRVGDCQNLEFADDSFDLVFSGDVFEHITYEQKQAVLMEIFRVLKPGGTVTIKTPNFLYLKAVIYLKRLLAVLRLKNPFNICIYHTRNNPDSEHIGLTSHKEMIQLFQDGMFHEPQIKYVALNRKGIPRSLANWMKKVRFFNQDLIMTARKPIFYGLYR